MAEPRHRKLVAMGIASWVSTGRSEVLGRLYTEIFNLWLDVFGELKEALADQSAGTTGLVTLTLAGRSNDPFVRSRLMMFWRNSLDMPSTLIRQEIELSLEADRKQAVLFLKCCCLITKLTFVTDPPPRPRQHREANCIREREIATSGSCMWRNTSLPYELSGQSGHDGAQPTQD